MAEGNEPSKVEEQRPAIEDVRRHLELLDQRLDNIDSTVSALVERVMSRPIALNITCPNCGKNVEIDIIGTGRPVV